MFTLRRTLLSQSSKRLFQYTNQQTILRTMSSSGFSNANTGDKPADPYAEANADPKVTLKEKVEALSKFAQNCKFGMMTTRDTSNGKLSSRCMAVAGQVRD